MLNLNDLSLFVAAVEHGGFAAASRQLGIPKSTLSKRVAELEQRLEARLIHRSSRSFTLTDVGRAFHEHARAALIEAEAAHDVVRQRAAEPSGTVRLTTSVPVAQQTLAPRLPELAIAYPRLHIQLDVSDRFVDVAQEGYDLAIRSHFTPLPDSELVQRLLSTEPIVLVAAPRYLDAAGPLQTPEALAGHDALLTGPMATSWRLDRDGETVAVSPRRRMTANESTALLSAAVAGLGVACLPLSVCRAALQRGEVVRVLPDWTAGRVMTSIVMPHRRGQLPAVRAVVEFLVECFAGE
ncbi:LysR family transcriptional regulator [Cupriavidus gilardii]|uniref:LysR substrate-binding domain-containing protein n=1 Tax=Cupriavidus gilardii TaxID=82541 RepID=UPI001EE4F054|nr:LysR substrate-binding domain-containing protein [Cupriavidus gilardii]MCG5261738.1 LysR substrate-binding domain-containing protein [Cupriavidus gilardii]MDF9429685.1 LysR family transcriptional regulator [Cupriavidus gilardii]